VDDADLELRNATYRLFVELGRAPTREDVAQALVTGHDRVRAGWERLHDQHAVVLDATTGEIRMANPFSAVPTPHRVHARGSWWYGNCAWDAFGICAALHVDGRVETTCPDCGEPIAVEVSGGRPDDESSVFHCLVPAERWWNDIGFT
jgi:hypothetical protein